MSAPQVTYYVVLPPQPPDLGASIRPISKLLREDEETTRQKLLTQTFEVVQRFAKRANAEGLRGQLAAFGVESFVVSDQEIRGHLFIFAATASKGGGGMALRDFADKPLFCPFNDITNIVLLPVMCDDGKEATLIDLHRKSTNITPRLDVALFDFPQMMADEKAGYEEFLHELEAKSGATVDRGFGQHGDKLTEVARDFGSIPGMFEPPPAMLVSTYNKDAIRAANFYSFLTLQRQVTLRG
jgi:hypothetical protein